jgi:hypothetical protein
MKNRGWWCALVLLLAGCATAQPTLRYTTGDVLLEEDFSRETAWEGYRDDAIGANFRVEDGGYRARIGSESFMWGLNAREHSDVVIEVETVQHSEDDNNAYGVMCRADPSNDSDGYYFLISGDGMWSIRRGTQGDGVEALVEWTRSSAIRGGRSLNTLRAVCVGDYLALWVNGEFAGEARDTLYSRGFAGLTAAARSDSQTDIAFDNLTIYEAEA